MSEPRTERAVMGAVTRKMDAEDVTAWVTERFIRESADSTVAEIVAGTGLSEGRVRKALHANRDLVWREEARPTYSRDYPMMEWRTHKVGLWGPRRETLARLLRTARTEGTT